MINAYTLLTRYGSPAYVYDLAQVRQAHAALRKALPEESFLYYSLKANPHPALVRALRQLGCYAEISSIGELRTTLMSGYRPEHCLYTGPGKTVQEIIFALQRGISYFSIDSPTDLQKVTAGAQATGIQAKVLLRINPDESVSGPGLTMTGVPSQFGVDASWVRREPAAFASAPLAQFVGFHIYMGTNIASLATLLQTFETASKTAAELAEVLHLEPEIVDLGGGFGHPFATKGERPDFSALRTPLEHMLDQYLPQWRSGKPQIAFEAGRYLTASAGTLYSTVQDIKVSRNQTFIILDSGINHLGGMAGLKRVPRIGAEVVRVNEPDGNPQLHQVHIVGPLCTPLDHLARNVDLPVLKVGEIVAIHNVGAYGLTGSLLAFLSRETPTEIVIDDEKLKEASQMAVIRCMK